jgi:SAM-dependent methyltransferase
MKMPQPLKQLLQSVISPEKYTRLTNRITLATTPRVKAGAICLELLRDKRGFEIGGPSPIFGRDGMLPVYTVAGTVDNCNFSTSTTWEGALSEGAHFRFNEAKPAGYQYIRDAVDLFGIAADSMDFVLSSHNIEHIANPVRALREWLRILKENGLLVLVVPHKEGTFDHLRPTTPLEHLISDFERATGEDDLSHLEEVLEFHDPGRAPGTSDRAEFRVRSEKNLENRCLHHHVFTLKPVVQLLDYLGMQILSAEAVLPMHIICVARKLPAAVTTDNEKYLSDNAACFCSSPFAADRKVAPV